MLEVTFGKQTLGRTLEKFVSGFPISKVMCPLLKCTGTVTGLPL
jgi:hypothetical protein